MARRRVGIDARAAHRGRGVGSYVANLVTALVNLQPDFELVIYTDQSQHEGWTPSDSYNLRLLPRRSFPVWEQLSLPRAVAHDKVDLIHYPANTGPVTHQPVPSVVTVHDLMYMASPRVLPLSPSPYQTIGRLYRRMVSPIAIRHARGVMVDSESTMRDLVAHFPEYANKAIVVPLAADPSAARLPTAEAVASLRQFGVTGETRFVLALGALEPRKNTERCLGAFAAFRRGDQGDFKIIVTSVKREHQPRYREWIQRYGIEGEVVLLPFVTNHQLIALYSLAAVLLYPSLYEGFGLPVLEAMSCGCPVITSKGGSIPEVAGDAALLVEATDTPGLAMALSEVVSNRRKRGELVDRGLKRATNFSWAKTASMTAAFYESAIRTGGLAENII